MNGNASTDEHADDGRENGCCYPQLYVGKLQASITVPYRMMRQTLIGEVSELYESEISLKTEEATAVSQWKRFCKFSWWKVNKYLCCDCIANVLFYDVVSFYNNSTRITEVRLWQI